VREGDGDDEAEMHRMRSWRGITSEKNKEENVGRDDEEEITRKEGDGEGRRRNGRGGRGSFPFF